MPARLPGRRGRSARVGERLASGKNTHMGSQLRPNHPSVSLALPRPRSTSEACPAALGLPRRAHARQTRPSTAVRAAPARLRGENVVGADTQSGSESRLVRAWPPALRRSSASLDVPRRAVDRRSYFEASLEVCSRAPATRRRRRSEHEKASLSLKYCCCGASSLSLDVPRRAVDRRPTECASRRGQSDKVLSRLGRAVRRRVPGPPKARAISASVQIL